MKNSRKLILLLVFYIPINLGSKILINEPGQTEEIELLKIILILISILVGIIFVILINDKIGKKNTDISEMFCL